MRSLRLSFYISLGAHALLVGAIVLGGLAWHEATLPGDGSPTPQILTIIGIPEEAPAEAISPPPPAAAPISAPPPPPVSPVSIPGPPPPPPPLAAMQSPAAPLVEPVVAVAPATARVTALQSTAPSPAPAVSAARSAGAPSPSAIPSDHVVSQPGGSAVAQSSAGEVRALPNYRLNPRPAYPLSARRHRQEGLVLLRVIVSAKGRAARVELKQSSGYTILDEAAIHAVREWEFEPARIGPLPVESEIEVPVRFQIPP